MTRGAGYGSSDPETSVVLLAGGGTGGHLYPNVAVAEHLEHRERPLPVHFLVSDRPGDARIVGRPGYAFTAVGVRPLPPAARPWRLPGFVRSWRRSVAETSRLLVAARVGAVVATGGFVSGPAVVAARRAGIPTALVNLDAVPGRANRHLARFADEVFSTYDSPRLAGARRVGLPLRRASTVRLAQADARRGCSCPIPTTPTSAGA